MSVFASHDAKIVFRSAGMLGYPAGFRYKEVMSHKVRETSQCCVEPTSRIPTELPSRRQSLEAFSSYCCRFVSRSWSSFPCSQIRTRLSAYVVLTCRLKTPPQGLVKGFLPAVLSTIALSVGGLFMLIPITRNFIAKKFLPGMCYGSSHVRTYFETIMKCFSESI